MFVLLFVLRAGWQFGFSPLFSGESQRRLPATGQLVLFFWGVDSAFALVRAGGLTPLCFFFRG